MISTPASTGGQTARTMSPTVRPVLTFPGVVRHSTPKRRTMGRSSSRLTPKTDGLDD